MHELLDQIEASLQSRLYFLSLFTSLSVPDIGGALSSENGEATGKKFVAWYEEWVRPRFSENVSAEYLKRFDRPFPDKLENPLDGESCYQFRCSLLHQGSAQNRKNLFERIIFIEPAATALRFHYTIMYDTLCIDLRKFCYEVIQGARIWLAAHEGDPTVQRNLERVVRRHPDGLPPRIVGIPVIG